MAKRITEDMVRMALGDNHLVDMSTVGRRSGQVHRHEIWLHTTETNYYLTGKPAPRDWYANLCATPALTIHLKHGLIADVPARAEVIRDPDQRRAILLALLANSPYEPQRDAWVQGSPLVRLHMTVSEASSGEK